MPTLKKLIIFSVSLIACFFVGIAIDLACGGEPDPYDYYVSFFHNNVQGQQNYGAFYLSYNYVFDDAEPGSETDINCSEWAAYLGNGVKPEDVKRGMYGISMHDDSVMLKNKLIAQNKLPDTLRGNRFLAAIAGGKNTGALQYYLFAKRVQPMANIAYDRWEPTPVDTTGLLAAGTEALEKAKAEHDQFLKLRYFYQAERLFHYGANYKQARAIYDDHIDHFVSASHVKGWALSLKAGEERRLGDTIKAAYLFSKVFAAYPERRVSAYKNFHYCSVNAADVIWLAANSNEKATIYAIASFGNPAYDLATLQKVYSYNPTADVIGTLLVRELNKLEEQYLTTKLNSGVNYNYDRYVDPDVNKVNKASMAEINGLLAFCNKLSADNKYKEAGIGYISSAYLTWMEGKSTQVGLNYLNQLDHINLNAKLTDQKNLVKLLLTAQKVQSANVVNQTELLPALKWLDKRAAQKVNKTRMQGNTPDEFYTECNENRFGASARDFYNLVLAQSYLKQKDTVMAALCILKSENTINPQLATNAPAKFETTNSAPVFWQHFLGSAKTEQLLRWKIQAPGTPYLGFLTSALSYISVNDLYDLLGTAYLREHNYTAAITAFKKIRKIKANEPVYTNNEAADPFISQLADYPKIFSKPGTKTYDKLLFAQKIVSIQNKAKADPKNAATYYFQMATGWYNASHYGNAYYLISYEWNAYDYGRASHYYYDTDYIKTQTAEAFYLQARASSTNAEFKARCTYMAAKCRQKQFAASSYMNNVNEDKYNKQIRNNPYFADLKKNYPKTTFYKTAVHECSYFRDYLSPAKKK
jgi:hypothetical protein